MKNSDYTTRFEAYLLTEKRVSDNTFGAYKKDIEQLSEFLGERLLTEIDVADLKSFLKELHDQGISARSLARKISTLKAFFRYLNTRFEIENISKDLRFPRLEKKLPRYLTEQEIKQLFIQAEKDRSALGERNRVMLYLMYVSGMRVTELVQLKTGSVHFDTGVIHIEGKGGKQRVVPISHGMCSMLSNFLQHVHPQLTKKQKTNFLFPVIYGRKVKPLTRQSFWSIIKSIWKKTGSKKDISPHQLRHSLATHMLKNGADLRSLQMLLGHENVSTVQIYTHVEKSHLRNVYDKKHPRS
jgi:integrase/recombinase XerD